MTDRMQRIVKLFKGAAFGLAVFFAGWAVYLILEQQSTINTLVKAEDDQDAVLDFLGKDNDSDECRDRLEQEFLGIVGILIIRSQEDAVDQIVIDRLTNLVDRLDQVDELCPAPPNPEPSIESG